MRIPVNGFLGIGAPFLSDFNLVVQVAMGGALVVGALLARAKRYRAHGVCQGVVLMLNLPLIAYAMWPSFYSQVLPVLPHHLTEAYYGVSSFHGFMGAGVELFGLYLLLAVGTKSIPLRFQLRRLKLWMRIELALWWIVILIGGLTYYFWYVRAS